MERPYAVWHETMEEARYGGFSFGHEKAPHLQGPLIYLFLQSAPHFMANCPGQFLHIVVMRKRVLSTGRQRNLAPA